MKFAPLYSFVEVIRNGANIKQAKTCTQGIPITRIETISNNKFNWDKLGYASIFDDKYKNFYLEDGDVLFSHINSKKFVGRSVLVKTNGKKIIHGMNLLKIRFKKDIFLPKFFIWYSQTQSFKTAINAIIKNAVNQSSVSIGDVKNIPVPSIDLHKQREIVENLNNIEQAIQVKQEQLKALDELIQSRFTEMFGNTAKNIIKKSLSVVCPIQAFGGDVESVDGKYWLLNLDAIESHTGYVLQEMYTSEIGSSTIKFSKDNVLYSKLRPYLNKVVIPNKSGYATSELVPFAPTKEINKYYFAYFLRSKAFVDYINANTNGARMPRASMDILKNFLIPVPPLPLQNQFAEFVQKMEKAKEIVKIQIDDLRELLALKMDEYFK